MFHSVRRISLKSLDGTFRSTLRHSECFFVPIAHGCYSKTSSRIFSSVFRLKVLILAVWYEQRGKNWMAFLFLCVEISNSTESGLETESLDVFANGSLAPNQSS